MWWDTPKCRAPGGQRYHRVQVRTWSRMAPSRVIVSCAVSWVGACVAGVLVCIHVPSGATVQHSIVQGKLLARNVLQGITFRAIMCYWGDPPLEGQEPRECVGGHTHGACSPPAQPVEHLSDGGLGCVSLAQDASRRRWARAIMRARMRSPRCIRSRCSSVYAVDDLLGEPGMQVDVFFLSVFLIPLLLAWRGGMEDSPLRRCLRISGFSDQSAGMENRALSLGRGFIRDIAKVMTPVAVSET